MPHGPPHIPDTASGATALAEGLKFGAEITPDRTAFHEHYGVRSEVEHRLAKAARGAITWRMIMGLAHRAIAQSAPIMPAFNDWHIGRRTPARAPPVLGLSGPRARAVWSSYGS